MKNPVHPGRIVRHDCLEPLGLSVTQAVKVLGVTRQSLNNIVNGKSGIRPEVAIRVTKAFGSTAETWLRMQLAYDLAAARKKERKIKGHRQHVQGRTRTNTERAGDPRGRIPGARFTKGPF
jgi:addiction module HigA family antidote